MQRLSTVEPYRERQLNLAQTIDHVPLLLEAVILTLQSQDFRATFDERPELKQRVADHARMRRSQGIPLDAVVSEYQFLREEIWCGMAAVVWAKGVTAEDMLEVVTRSDYAIDIILQVTVQAFEQEERSA